MDVILVTVTCTGKELRQYNRDHKVKSRSRGWVWLRAVGPETEKRMRQVSKELTLHEKSPRIIQN